MCVVLQELLQCFYEWLRKGSNGPVGASNGLRWPWVACRAFYGLVARLKPSMKACRLYWMAYE